MPSFVIAFDPSQIKAIQGRLADVKNGVPKALAGAINDTAQQERTQVRKKLREKYNIKNADLDKRISITKATQRKTSGGLHIEKSKRLGLQYFGARQVGSTKRISNKLIAFPGGGSAVFKIFGGGVKAAIERGKSKLYVGAFMGPRPGTLAPQLHGGVFQRVGKSRLPIKKLFGLSPWGMFLKSGMLGPTANEMEELVQLNIERRVKFLVMEANKPTINTTMVAN